MSVVAITLAVITVLLVQSCFAYGPFVVNQNETFLKMPSTGVFKILQFADIHYANGASTGCKDILDSQKPCTDLNSTAWIEALLDLEKPNLVVFTGDNIMGEDSVDHKASVQAILKPLSKRKIPHMMILGNHDDENNKTPNVTNLRHKIIAYDMADPYSLTKAGPKYLHGIGNYAYGILGPNGKQTHTLYLLDSSSYDITGTVGGYDWMRPNQLDWYNGTSWLQAKRLKKNLPAVLFQHIPIEEYETAWHCNKGTDAKPLTYTGFGSSALPDGYYSMGGAGLFAKMAECPASKDKCVGVKMEGVYSPKVNYGLMSVLLDRNEVKMINVGHDHVNDHCCPFSNSAINVCYGGGFGYHAYGQAGWPRRSRVIRLYANGTIDTYKRLDKWSSPPYTVIDKQVIYKP